MPKRKEVGQRGENAAVNHLQSKGYVIREKNWRKHPAEVDIICHGENTLVFVEVKARTDQGFSIEEWGIDNKKLRTLTDAAYAYMQEVGWEGEFRFDIITIAFHSPGEYEIKHYPDAFFPGLQGF